MTPLKHLVLLTLTLSTISASAAITSSEIDFINNNLEFAKQKAQTEGKLIMVDFWASWCGPCKWMDKETFGQSEVSKYLNNSYISLRVDIDNFDGMDIRNAYNVRFLPTIIVLDPHGNIIQKYEESMAPSKLLRELKAHEKLRKPTAGSNRVIRNAPINYSRTESDAHRPAISTDRPSNSSRRRKPFIPAITPKKDKKITSVTNERKSKKQRMYSTSTPVTRIETQPNTPPTEQPPSYSNDIYKTSAPDKLSNGPVKEFGISEEGISEVGLYQMNVKKAPRTGFSVQVGAYYNYKSVLTEVAKFQKSFAEEVLVHISEYRGTTCYKVMLGHYTNRMDAFNDTKLLRASGVTDAFVKDLATLKNYVKRP
ncbi:MAG: thioredoxin family protein [Bacteroidota bacterium]